MDATLKLRAAAAPLAFLTASIIATTCDVSLYWVLTAGAGVSALLANVFSFGTGTLVSFGLNRAITFGRRDVTGSVLWEAAKFLGTALSSLAISMLTIWLATVFVAPIVGKLISLPLTFVWSYWLSSRIVFGRHVYAKAPSSKSAKGRVRDSE